MVNTNIQGVIPLAGPGQSLKTFGNMQPGEYHTLLNCELNAEGAIINRRPIKPAGSITNDSSLLNGTTDGMVQDCQKILGTWGAYTLVSSATVHRAWDPEQNEVELWDPADLTPVPTDGYHLLAGGFFYNNTYYWLSAFFDEDLASNEYAIYVHDYTGALESSIPIGLTYAGLDSSTKIIEFSGFGNNHSYRNFTVHADRLWVCTNEGVYFSKATDPTIFAAPDGGFFKFPGDQINYIMSLRDTVYVICSDSIWTITYTSDPNQDATVRKIANVGGQQGCIHKDTPYFVSAQGIHQINNFSVEVIVPFNGYYTNVTHLHIESFQEYIVVTASDGEVNFLSNGTTGLESVIDPLYSPTSFGFSNQVWPCIFFNMDLGSAHAVHIRDTFDALDYGTIVTSYSNTYGESNVDPYLFLLANNFSGEYRPYCMSAPRPNDTTLDLVFKADGSTLKVYPEIIIEKRGFSPDGNNYMMKKFRSLELMGFFPKDLMEIEIGYGRERFYDRSFDLDFHGVDRWSSELETYKARIQGRLGINQRAYDLNIRIKTSNSYVEYTDDPSQEAIDFFILEDMRVLWSYLGRAIDTSSPETT